KCDNTRPKVSMHWSGADCPVVAMKRCNARGAKGAGHSAGKQVNGQPDEPGSTGRRQPSTSGTSRVKREFQARFCERLRVRFPRPTRQIGGGLCPHKARVVFMKLEHMRGRYSASAQF